MSRPILVPLDGSYYAEHALPVAAGLARSTGAPIALVRVHSPVTPVENLSGVAALEWWWEEARRTEQEYLQKQAAALQAQFGIRTSTHLLYGGVSHVLAALVRRFPARLVVMTTHGRGGLNRIWLGSTADALIRESSAPVLLIRPTEENEVDPDVAAWRGFEHVLVALDGTERAEGVLPDALAVGGADARYTLFRVAQPVIIFSERYSRAQGERYRRQLDAHTLEAQRYVDDLAGRLRTLCSEVVTEVIAEVPVAQSIIQYAEREGVDLIALATRGRSGWARFAAGSVADKVIRSTRLPLLILGPKGRAEAVAAADDRQVAAAHGDFEITVAGDASGS